MTLDSTTWAALAFVLAAIGAGWSWVAYQRRGVTAGARGLAWTLLPVAAWLTGTLELAGDIAADVGDWASGLVLSPVVWAGIVLAGISVVLFGATGVARRRGIGTTRPRAGADAAAAAAPGPVGGEQPRQLEGRRTPAAGSGSGLDDDVSEILRKHGIS